MKPDERMDPFVMMTVRRYLSYHWKNAVIKDLIRFRFSLKLSEKCLNTIRQYGDCTRSCLENCCLKDRVM
ncbi:MAG: hypothetical protein K6G17_07090 [Oscillospiraceae bacterium]|nr:hypothetical protein [Oscillospiraceae bacterium]